MYLHVHAFSPHLSFPLSSLFRMMSSCVPCPVFLPHANIRSFTLRISFEGGNISYFGLARLDPGYQVKRSVRGRSIVFAVLRLSMSGKTKRAQRAPQLRDHPKRTNFFKKERKRRTREAAASQVLARASSARLVVLGSARGRRLLLGHLLLSLSLLVATVHVATGLGPACTVRICQSRYESTVCITKLSPLADGAAGGVELHLPC